MPESNLHSLARTSLSAYFQSIFGCKVQKIAVNAGLGCPNRDGTAGTGGCIFCNNDAFNPRYAHDCSLSVTEQLRRGTEFFSVKSDAGAYLAYFQTYSNTYGDTEHLIELYEEALAFPGVRGLVLATRPDCLSPDLLDYFSRRFGSAAPGGHPYLLVEIGVESTENSTLTRINRGHDFECAASAIGEISGRGIDVGVHLILGLPGEGPEDFIKHARRISELPVKTLKLHHLQVIRGTALEREYIKDPECVHLFTPQEYADTVRTFCSHLREDIILDRLVSESPKDMVTAPSWGLKPSEFAALFKLD